LTQAQVHVNGHAIEARICAETPDHDFLPAIGHLHVLKAPPASRFCVSPVRWDSGVREGDSISPHYDSMIAKLIVHGETREQALARLDQALSQLHVSGVQNNVAFLRRLLRTDSFAHAQLDTALITREHTQLFGQTGLPITHAVAAAVAAQLRAEQPPSMGWTDPWSLRNDWLLQGQSRRHFVFQCQGVAYPAVLTRTVRGGMTLRMADQEAAFDWADEAGPLQWHWGSQSLRCHVYRHGQDSHVFAEAGEVCLTRVDPLAHDSQDTVASGNLAAPMPGKLLSFAVSVGEKVAAGQALAVMEAMKMEHTVAAPTAGTVAELLYAPGDQVAEGAPLLRLTTE
jgi:3-methylcrotonyl-CoA carboxylase alpha subunit